MQAWDYTPAEIGLICEQVVSKRNRALNELIYLAWHTEAFARQKRLPALDRVLKDENKKSSNVSKSDLILKKMAREKGVIIK
ncbi:MAG: hypothetical protein IJ371_04180 [Clostridia bacterium]|nr:hypothetical protein [Clostridia bacterium]